ALREERLLAGRRGVTVAPRALARAAARPHPHVHPERLPVPCDHAADPAVAVNAERLPAERVADAYLPGPRLEGGDLLWKLAHCREHECPGELRGGVRRRPRVHARRDDHPELRAGVDIDVRVDAALANEPEPRQPMQES